MLRSYEYTRIPRNKKETEMLHNELRRTLFCTQVDECMLASLCSSLNDKGTLPLRRDTKPTLDFPCSLLGICFCYGDGLATMCT
jgi:hypothetical protein